MAGCDGLVLSYRGTMPVTRKEAVGVLKAIALVLIAGVEVSAATATDCVQRLRRFIPEKIEIRRYAFHARIWETSWPFVVTADLRRQQIEWQYRQNKRLQAEYETADEYVEAMWSLYEAEEERTRNEAPSRTCVEMWASEHGMYARYYDPEGPATCTQEVVKLAEGPHAYPTWRIDHTARRIIRTTEKHANDYYGYLVGLAPEQTVYQMWRSLWPLALRLQGITGTPEEVICREGRLTLGGKRKQVETVEFIGKDRCRIISRSEYQGLLPDPSVTDRTVISVTELRRDRYVRQTRFFERSPRGETRVEYRYGNPESRWPTEKLWRVDPLPPKVFRTEPGSGNLYVGATAGAIRYLEVMPAEKLDLKSIRDRLLKKYSDYEVLNVADKRQRQIRAPVTLSREQQREKDASPGMPDTALTADQKARLAELRQSAETTKEADDYRRLAEYCWHLYFDEHKEHVPIVRQIGLESAQRCLELDPDATNVLLELSHYYLRIGQVARAESYITKLSRLDFGKAEALLTELEDGLRQVIAYNRHRMESSDDEGYRRICEGLIQRFNRDLEQVLALHQKILAEQRDSR